MIIASSISAESSPLITRMLVSIAIVFVAGSPLTRAQVGNAEKGRGDRARLVEGVREIAAPGSPGSLAVYAPTANAVVVGNSDGGGQVAVIASGHLGRGRLAAFAHDGYFRADQFKVADTGRLILNAIRWASGDKPKPRIGLIDVPELQSLFEREGWPANRTTLDESF